MSRRIVIVIGMAAVAAGVVLLFMASGYERYSDEDEYRRKLAGLTYEESSTQQFHDLRAQYITPKFKLEDYGATLAITGLAIAAVGFWASKIRTPRTKWETAGVGMLAATLTSTACAGDIIMQAGRGAYPPWADSFGIALFLYVPLTFGVSLAWAGICATAMRGDFRTGVPVFPFRLGGNIFLVLLLLFSLALTVLFTACGIFWIIPMGFCWCWFYISLMLGRWK